METKQIKAALAKYNYPTDAWTNLETITMIFMDHDERLYPDSKTVFYFDTTNEILKFVNGKKINGVFHPFTDKPIGEVPFSAIGGFIQTSKISYNGQILYR